MTLARRIVVWIAGALLVLAAALAALLWWGPVTISDKRLMLDFLLGRGVDTPAEEVIARHLKAAPGFSVNLYAGDLPLARWLRPTSAGDLLVSRTRAGEVMLLERDRNGDAKADGRRILLTGLDRPHGLDIHQGWLYVAERTAVGRIRFDEQSGSTSGSYQHVITGLTGDGFHLTRTIRFGPDGMLYLAQGSTCNACIEEDKRRATIMRFAPDGSGGEIFATGLRNSVGFDWAPWDDALFATENGRDLLGDDFPPDELNRIQQGQFYGWPFVHGFGVPDPDMRDASKLTIAVPPVHAFAPHNAPLGIRFLRSTRRPPGFEQAAVVALHGSWNRSKPDGYKVVSLHWTRDGIEQRDFFTGFLSEDGIIGRPADVAEGPDGAVYVSDDYAGAIYRVAPDSAPAPVE